MIRGNLPFSKVRSSVVNCNVVESCISQVMNHVSACFNSIPTVKNNKHSLWRFTWATRAL